MCRHCERLIEDVADKKLIHDFMENSAAKINRKINEDLAKASMAKYPGYPSGETVFTPAMTLQNPVTADDIDLKFNVTATFWHNNPFNGTRAQIEVYRMLQKAFE
jgi:hypothetical protein